MFPVIGTPANVLNTGLYLYEGDYGNAAMSAISLVPIPGGAFVTKAFRGTKRTASNLGKQVAKHVDDAPGLLKRVRNGLTGCFTEGTQVVVGMEYDPDGNFVSYVTMNIENIQVGDLVYSYNTLTGETELCAVTSTLAKTSDHINYLTIIDENGNEQVIESTDVHPFWVVTDEPDLSRAARSIVDENGLLIYHENLEAGQNGFWVEAKDLHVGDIFLGANGESSTLTNIVRVEQEGGIGIFNFTVEGNHNYFILAKDFEFGQSCVLVHNALLCRNARSPESLSRLARKAAEAELPKPNGLGIHGVSASPNKKPWIPDSEYVSAQRSDIEKYFEVRNTPRQGDIDHVTIVLPKPVTPEVVKVFNSLFWGN